MANISASQPVLLSRGITVIETMSLRDRLVETALAWQDRYGVAPSITAAISEYDAAVTLLGMSEEAFRQSQLKATAVQRGYDFTREGVRYQVKANRPSGRPGSKVTLCAKARNYDWDYLIWILYDREYRIQEAWEWPVADYMAAFDQVTRLSPSHMRLGKSSWNDLAHQLEVRAPRRE